MGNMKTLAFLLTAAVAMMVPVGGAHAAGALAVGVPDDVAKDGISLFGAVQAKTVAAAREDALEGCRKTKSAKLRMLCKIVGTFSNQCVAQAMDPQNGTPGYGWAIADTADEARKQAVAKCRSTAGPTRQDACTAGDVSCDGTARGTE
jgi:Domain of unknown function (DUF4189)